jgi:hypothetical protein
VPQGDLDARSVRQQLARVAGARRGEDLLRLALLDDATVGHDRHAVGDRTDQGQVVGDEQQTQAHLGAQPAQQLDDGRLDGDVERGGDLVADEELWLRRQRTPYGDPLSLAARESWSGNRFAAAADSATRSRHSATRGPTSFLRPGKKSWSCRAIVWPTVRRGFSEA